MISTNRNRRLTIAIGVFMVIVMGSSVFVPFLRTQTTSTTPAPTDIPIPTFAPPPPDLNSISFSQLYLHPSALFTVGQPAGWTPSPPVNKDTQAQITMINFDNKSVLEASIEKALSPINTLDDLSAHYTSQFLNDSWQHYSAWAEASRSFKDNKLQIDFTLTLSRQTYIARQISWSDGSWIYSLRVVAPENASDLLLYLLGQLSASFTPLTEFASSPFGWTSFYDADFHHIIRYPASWTIADRAPNHPASITGGNGVNLRVEGQPGASVADEAAARAWVNTRQSGATILSVVPVTRDNGQGFSVSYSYTDSDGENQSALAVLLNAPDNALHIATLHLPAQVDLNDTSAVTASSIYDEAATVMSTFRVWPASNFSVESLPPTPTPRPTQLPPTPTLEATQEATSEATAASTEAAATTEATAEVTAAESAATAEFTTTPAAEMTATAEITATGEATTAQ